MLKALIGVVFLFSISVAEGRAQQSEVSATSSATVTTAPLGTSAITSATTGMSYLIEARRPPTGVQRVSTAATTDAGTSARLNFASLSVSQRGVLEKLNRVDSSRLSKMAAVVVPTTWSDDELAYSPFPLTYAWAMDKPKTIVVDQAAQAFGAYEYGELVRWGPVSTGEGGKTPSGLFHLSWRSRGHRSSVDPSWYLEWYFNFIPARGIAFHQYALPGRAASHGCVRMLQRDAQWLFDWGEARSKGNTGTTVIVLNCPDSARAWQTGDFLTRGVTLPENPESRMQECSGYSGATAASHRKAIR
jgi:lipoprotein-anchoring transpeptidase ErfK/SrfK